MRREFFTKATTLSIMIAVFTLVAMAGSAMADSTIMLSGHINYEGPGGVFYSPDGANVSARYMGQEYFTRADINGNYAIGPIPMGSDYILSFKINYTDPDGNYHIWPLDGWHETLLPVDGKVVQDMILIKSTAPTPATRPIVTPAPTPVSSSAPSPTPVPAVSPAPPADNAATATPVPAPTATPAPTKTPSLLLSSAGTLAVLALIGYIKREKQ